MYNSLWIEYIGNIFNLFNINIYISIIKSNAHMVRKTLKVKLNKNVRKLQFSINILLCTVSQCYPFKVQVHFLMNQVIKQLFLIINDNQKRI